MPEAVIVSTARSPIGRAGKGSLISMRPDDLATQMVRAAMDKVPSLDPRDIDDLMMGCGQPGGESGFNIARVVAVELGYDYLPGVTVNRYCSSSLQTTRMAFHAIKAGEGHAFISAGVETVSRFPHGTSDGWPDSRNPMFNEAEARTALAAEQGAASWHDPREDGQLPDVYIAMGQTAENVALYTGISREDIVSQKLPLPLRDMRPLSLEEQLICYADKFYSKNPQKLRIEKPVEKISAKLARFGEDKVQQFERWVEQFGT